MLAMSKEPAAPVTLMYEGWQVWDNQYGPVRVGEDFTASVEFVQRSPLRTAETGAEPQIEHVVANRYVATARVLDTIDAVVLDLGSLRALRWVRPGESAGDFTIGTTVSLDLSLSLNGWDDTPWTNRAAELYGTNHTWHVRRIVRRTIDQDDAEDIAEASTETVDSAHQYCLLECSLLDPS
jgi:hypothetical protein